VPGQQYVEKLRKLLVEPLLRLLREGATPERLAWSLAAGFVIGVNPLLGSTTVLALLIAPAFRLNVVASQFTNHLAYPLELMLFPLFVKLGSLLFRTAALPFQKDALLSMVRHHPWDTTRLLWTWEWHALVVWGLFGVVAAPLIAMGLRPVLRGMLVRAGVGCAL
jgi:uncharacterized protein (DUF2062 family)